MLAEELAGHNSILRAWQQTGHDKGTVAGTFPDDPDLVAMVKSLPELLIKSSVL